MPEPMPGLDPSIERVEAPPLRDLDVVLARVREGGILATDGVCWRLVQTDELVDGVLVRLMQVGGALLEPLDGRLVPCLDQLPCLPRHMSQTWRWVDGMPKAVS